MKRNNAIRSRGILSTAYPHRLEIDPPQKVRPALVFAGIEGADGILVSVRKDVMVAKTILPSRFPIGTRFVIEGRPGKRGTIEVTQRCLIMPDGTKYDLLGRSGIKWHRSRNRRHVA